MSLQWFEESVASGYCMPEGEYSVDQTDRDTIGSRKPVDLKRRPSSAKLTSLEWVKGLEKFQVPIIADEEFLKGCKVRCGLMG